MSKLDKVDKFGKILGVERRTVYKYMKGKGMPLPRASFADAALGGGVMLWAEDGGIVRKIELYNKAEL